MGGLRFYRLKKVRKALLTSVPFRAPSGNRSNVSPAAGTVDG